MQMFKTQFFQKLIRMVVIYLLYIVAHYVSANLYQRYCTPVSWFGFLASPFATALPQCQALRWIVFNTGNNITAMWMMLGAWLINIFLTYGPFYDQDQDQAKNMETTATRREQEEAAAKKAAKKAARREEAAAAAATRTRTRREEEEETAATTPRRIPVNIIDI